MKSPLFNVNQTWLECIKCNNRADLLKERGFFCQKCGNLFDVCHDFSRIGNSSFLKKTFSNRMSDFSCNNENWQQSGVWRYRELIMPHLPEQDIVSLAEGNVPIVKAGRNLSHWVGTNNLWLILEGMTPTGSFKDFGGTVLISIAKAAGINAVVCASTGDTSAMAAAYAASAGMKCAVILPAGKITPVQLAQPLVHGAKVILVPGPFDDCMKIVLELVEKYGAYPANSLNPARIEGHQATAFQIAHFFNWEMPNWIVVPVGNGSNCSSVGKGIRTMKETGILPHSSHCRILGCQSEAACPLALSFRSGIYEWEQYYMPKLVGETDATAARIGDPVSAKKVMREIFLSNGLMEIAAERDLRQAVSVCGQDGIFVCPQTGIALAGVRNAVQCETISEDETIVVVSTATGLKFTDSAARNLQNNIINLDDCRASSVAKVLQL